MKEDQYKWDNRYQNRVYPTTPSTILTEFRHQIKPGKALDIATGNGRNALYLQSLGFNVEAVDISSIGFENNIKSKKNIRFIHEDLDSYQIPQDNFDLIVNINFLDRRLFPQIREGLKTNGMIIFETFLKGPIQTRIDFKSHYLESNELLNSFCGFRIIHYSESKIAKRGDLSLNIASLVAQKE